MDKIRNITVSGRIGSGATTLGRGIAESLGWRFLEGGALFEEISRKLKLDQVEALLRPDKFDLEYEEKIKNILTNQSHYVIQSHLAGFDAQGIEGVFKILLVCEDSQGNDKTDIRIDRIINRDRISIEQAKREVIEREKQHLEKFRRLYANNDKSWVYWDRKYYDLVINTYNHNPEETLEIALMEIKKRMRKD
jgi:cytidylate kinase